MSEKSRTVIGLALFAGFAVMFLIGARSSEVTHVWHKAINICMECIGIG